MSVCGFIKASGDRCRARAMKESQWCYVHDPALEEKRQRNNSKGGRRGGKGRPSTVLARLQTRLEELAEQVLAGEVEQDVASTAGRLLNYSGTQMRNFLAARESEELEERVAELEEALERQKQEEKRSRYAR
jgi:hypothetical protein